MSVRVAAQQSRLEEEQAGRPHSGRPAEPGEYVLANHQLDAEEKKCAQENCGGKQQAPQPRIGGLINRTNGLLNLGELRNSSSNLQ